MGREISLFFKWKQFYIQSHQHFWLKTLEISKLWKKLQTWFLKILFFMSGWYFLTLSLLCINKIPNFIHFTSVNLNYQTWQRLALTVQCWQTRTPERTNCLPVSLSPADTRWESWLSVLRKYSLQVFTFCHPALLHPALRGDRQRGQFQTQIIVGSLPWN